jgi:hypothetical protein
MLGVFYENAFEAWPMGSEVVATVIMEKSSFNSYNSTISHHLLLSIHLSPLTSSFFKLIEG